MVIIIYSNQEVKEFEKTKEREKILQDKCIQKDENALKNDACINNNQSAKAKDIITYRETNKFNTIEDIKNVSGIGDALFAKIKENITI